jgi:hypothetical protein
MRETSARESFFHCGVIHGCHQFVETCDTYRDEDLWEREKFSLGEREMTDREMMKGGHGEETTRVRGQAWGLVRESGGDRREVWWGRADGIGRERREPREWGQWRDASACSGSTRVKAVTRVRADSGGNDESKVATRLRSDKRDDASKVATRDVQRKTKIITGERDETRVSNLIRYFFELWIWTV